MLTAARGGYACGSIHDCLFVVAELVHDGRMFDKHGFERRWVTRDLIIAESSSAIGEEIDASGIGGLG